MYTNKITSFSYNLLKRRTSNFSHIDMDEESYNLEIEIEDEPLSSKYMKLTTRNDAEFCALDVF